MKKENIKTLLNSLEIGKSIAIESTDQSILIQTIKESKGNFILNKASETMYSILKIDKTIVAESSKILSIVKRLNHFNRIEMDFSPGYVRTIISSHNRKNGDNVKVIKNGDGVVISRSSIDIENTPADQLSEMIDELNTKFDTPKEAYLSDIEYTLKNLI